MTRRLASVPDAQSRDGAYIRVSAVMGREGDDFLSPTVQLDTIRAASQRDGGTLVEVWEDLDVSGRSMQRAGLDRAMQAARDGRIDRLYVYDLSRWARNAAEGLTELAAIERAGVEVVSATERIDRTTTSGRLTAGVLLLLAEHYSDLIGDRWRGVLQANAERGVLHGRAPLGYVRVGRREVEPDPVLGPAVTDAFGRFAAGGASLRQLALELARVRGQALTPNTLRLMLRSPVYLGRVQLNGKTYPGRHQPLTDELTWLAAQRRLDENGKTPARTLAIAHPLAGLVRCDHCGWTLWRQHRSGRPGLRPFFSCRSRKDDGSSRCPGIGTPRIDDVLAVVLDRIRVELVEVPDETAAEAARLAEAARGRADAAVIAADVARLEKSLGQMAVHLASGTLSDAAYRAGTSQLEETLTGLRQRYAAAMESAAAPSFAASRDLASALLELWESMMPAEQNASLKTHVREVRVRRRLGVEPISERVTVVLR